MKPLSFTLLAIGLLAVGFIAGLFFANYDSQHKFNAENEQISFLIKLHDYQREQSKKASIAADTVLREVLRLIENDSTLSPKGKDSKDPIKRLLLESYDCLSRSVAVIDNYDRQVYVQDSAFFKKYFKLEE
jgi:hypothetical protein